jgi:beta-glucosidase-like glycosyl hydrolase
VRAQPAAPARGDADELCRFAFVGVEQIALAGQQADPAGRRGSGNGRAYGEGSGVRELDGVGCVLLSSGLLNGVSMHSNGKIVTDLLKGELRFDRFLLSDADGIYELRARHMAAELKKDAVRLAVNARIDVVMEYDLEFCGYLAALVRESAEPMARVGAAVRWVLCAKMRLNLWSQSILSGDYSLTHAA